MDKQPRQAKRTSSHLFTVRIWREWVDQNRQEWRGQVEQVLSGKNRYFRQWSALISFLEEALAALEPDSASTHSENAPSQNTDVDQVP